MITYRRHLPHLHPREGAIFTTFRLANSIPNYIIDLINNEHQSRIDFLKKNVKEKILFKEKIYDINKKYFAKYDKFLDGSTNKSDFDINSIVADIISQKIKSFDEIRYELLTYCIMPNHVHLLVYHFSDLEINKTNLYGKGKNYSFSETLRLIKGSTSREANKILNRSGSFWHHESYDHIVRNEKELNNIVNYILQNPVKAGLINEWKNWKWSYCKYDI
jgi:putative transposase